MISLFKGEEMEKFGDSIKPLFDQLAFPVTLSIGEENKFISHGLTKREYFAATAMQGLLAGIGEDEDWIVDETAVLAVRMADALIKTLVKKEKP